MGVEFNIFIHTWQRPMLQTKFRTQATTFKTKLSSNPCRNAVHFYARFRKFAKSNYELRHVCSSVCPSVRMERLDSQRTNLYEILHLIIFGKSFEKIQVSWKSDNDNGYFTWRLMHVLIIFRSILPIMNNVSDKAVEKVETHINIP